MLFEQAFYFSDELYGLSALNTEGIYDTKFSADHILKVASGVLSVVLSHHF